MTKLMSLVKGCIHLIASVASSLCLLALVISIASPRVWFNAPDVATERKGIAVPAPKASTATERAESLLSRAKTLDGENNATPLRSDNKEGSKEPVSRNFLPEILSRLLAAGYLDTAPPGMLVMYGLLLLAFTSGMFTALSRIWNGTEYAAHALPFLGVAGTLMSFMIFAAGSKAGVGNLRDSFVSSLSYAAFTTIYGLFGSLILELWLLRRPTEMEVL